MVTDLFFFVPFATMFGIFLTLWLEDREPKPVADAHAAPAPAPRGGGRRAKA
ncbi:MAG: hypothetical protein HY900_22800 [Deltaproteobacteria bacterium]|nr:hypothetical protein [Deltaproteobacteria bacterium]